MIAGIWLGCVLRFSCNSNTSRQLEKMEKSSSFSHTLIHPVYSCYSNILYQLFWLLTILGALQEKEKEKNVKLLSPPRLFFQVLHSSVFSLLFYNLHWNGVASVCLRNLWLIDIWGVFPVWQDYRSNWTVLKLKTQK